jgi:hypothetical protein
MQLVRTIRSPHDEASGCEAVCHAWLADVAFVSRHRVHLAYMALHLTHISVKSEAMEQ